MKRSSHSEWDAALDIIERLRQGGHRALLAGGCVRDRLLGREPKDYDVATDATPQRVKELFPRARQVGAKFGVMLVRRLGHELEVATFRTDGSYSDGRHPDSVQFGTDGEDAERRDFTINGLFFDPIADRIIDHVGGRADLEAGVVRTIGDPAQRFAEDHLRMLRAVRFAARLGFLIDPATRQAIAQHAHRLEAISPERIWRELAEILTSPTRAMGWSLVIETGLAPHLVPGWCENPAKPGKDLARLAALPDRIVSPASGMAALLCRRSSDEVSRVCRGLRLSNKMAGTVAWLVCSVAKTRDEEDLDLAGLKVLMAQPAWPELLELFRADLLAEGTDLEIHRRFCARAASIAPEAVAPPPLITGDDLRAVGMTPGPRLGEVLEQVRHAQLNEVVKQRDAAFAMARRLWAG